MRFVFIILGLLLFQNTFPQTNNDTIFITIGNQHISKGEFERIYIKNNSISTIDKQNIEEYLPMFVNFKLKVQAAIDAGYDTCVSFRKELKEYRDQLAKSYLTNNRAIDSLVAEAYQRMHTEVCASHIMVSLRVNSTPSDTLFAWNRIMNIRQRVLNGESFEKLAWELSDDPSAKQNKGNLGYFTAFQMVYPFESATFNNKIGDISMPVRSRFGYHIIWTTDKRPARGEVKVAHIMMKVPQGAPDSSWFTAENKIKEIENKLKAGDNFAILAKEHSEDRESAKNGGELPFFGTGKMIPEFEQAAFQLQYPGDISKPVKTFYGWHIIKLIEKKAIPEFDKLRQDIRSKISRDERMEYCSNSLVSQLKKEYQFFENTALLEDLSLKSSFMEETNSQQILFRFSDQKFLLGEFVYYMNSLPRRDSTIAPYDFIMNTYKDYVKKQVLTYEDRVLESKYPDFKNLVQEYHDGILLFNLSDSLIWSKASKDTIGIEKYFKANREKYLWPQRVEASVIQCSSAEIAAKAHKLARQLKSHQKLEAELTKTICGTSLRNDCITINYNTFAKGDNILTDSISWKKGISPILVFNKISQFAVIHKLIPACPKPLEDSRGLVISDYQNTLEQEWVDTLKKKYTVVINNEVLKQLIKEYASKN